MYSVILIFAGLCVIGLPIMLVVGPDEKDKDETYKKKSKNLMKVFFVFLATVIVLATIAIFSMIHQRNAITKGCVAIDIPTTEQNLYYDEMKNEYFFMKSDNWDLTRLFVRDVIDYETGKTIDENNQAIKNAIKNIEEKLK